MSAGMLFASAGLFGLAQIQVASSYDAVWPFMVLLGLGVGLVLPAVSAAGMASVGPDQSGIASGVINASRQVVLWRFCQKHPKAARRLIRYLNAKMLPEDYPVDEHFNPPYDPWDQRMCIVPDGDLFRVIRDGKASVVTGHIETFTENGVQLLDGRQLAVASGDSGAYTCGQDKPVAASFPSGVTASPS